MDPCHGQGLPKLMRKLRASHRRSEVFWEDYVAAHKPLVVRGGAKHGRGYEKWDVDWLEKNYGCAARGLLGLRV